MSRGIVVFAQNNASTNYVEQACLLAMSLTIHNTIPISIITNDNVPLEYHTLFDNIIPIPFGDASEDSEWKIENRWKIYHCSPYTETIVMDTDMIMLQNIDAWWNFLSKYELFFTNKVFTYRGNLADTTYYRKTFIDNNLPNLFSGFHYFKKCEFSHNFYHWLEFVINNWESFYEQHLIERSRPLHMSIDVCAAITARILDCEQEITNNISMYPSFTHMKVNCQDWSKGRSLNWQDHIGVYFSKNGNLKLGNYSQTGILHYTENDFIEKTPAIEYYRSLINV